MDICIYQQDSKMHVLQIGEKKNNWHNFNGTCQYYCSYSFSFWFPFSINMKPGAFNLLWVEIWPLTCSALQLLLKQLSSSMVLLISQNKVKIFTGRSYHLACLCGITSFPPSFRWPFLWRTVISSGQAKPQPLRIVPLGQVYFINPFGINVLMVLNS